MDIYNYHPDTNEYISTTEADLDPIDNLPLIPAFATDIKILDNIKKNYTQIFDNKKWVKIKDFRGTVYNKETKESQYWNELGELPKEFTNIEPIDFSKWNDSKKKWIIDLIDLKNIKKYQISESFNNDLDLPYMTSLNIELSLNLMNIYNIELLINKFDETVYIIIDINNNIHDLTITSASKLLDELKQQYFKLYNKKCSLYSKIDESNTKDDINSIVW